MTNTAFDQLLRLDDAIGTPQLRRIDDMLTKIDYPHAPWGRSYARELAMRTAPLPIGFIESAPLLTIGRLSTRITLNDAR